MALIAKTIVESVNSLKMGLFLNHDFDIGGQIKMIESSFLCSSNHPDRGDPQLQSIQYSRQLLFCLKLKGSEHLKLVGHCYTWVNFSSENNGEKTLFYSLWVPGSTTSPLSRGQTPVPIQGLGYSWTYSARNPH